MITDETYFEEERKIRALFKEAGWEDRPEPNATRIELITERAIHESIIKDSTSFIFRSFTSVITNFLSAFFGSVKSSDDDYRP